MAARGFRPRAIASVVLVGVLMWQALPAVAGWQTAADSRAQNEDFWYPVIAFLEQRADPDHRVQVVATADNWEAFYLAKRGVPLARGWFRQDDFPATRSSTRSRSRRSGTRPGSGASGSGTCCCPATRSTTAPRTRPSSSARARRACARSPRVGGWTIYELPHATPIATPADGIGCCR